MKKEEFKRYLNIVLAGTVGIILCIVFFFVVFRFDEVSKHLSNIQNILMPFIYGGVIAYLLTPICNWIEKKTILLLQKGMKKESRIKKIASFVSILGSLLFAGFIIYLLIAMVLPQVIESVKVLIDVLPSTIESWVVWIENYIRSDQLLSGYAGQLIDTVLVRVDTYIDTELLPSIQTIVTGVSAGLWNIVIIVKNLLIGIMVAAYLMASRKIFSAQGKKLTYSFFKIPTANSILEEADYIHHIFIGFIGGKLLDSLIIGCICFVVMNMMNMPYGVLISVIIGVTNIVPFFGPFIGAIPSALIVLTVSPIQCVYFIIFVLILQQFDGNILGPKILGDSTGLPSFWVLFSIIFFGGIWGFVGMIVGVPTFAVIYDLIKKFSQKSLMKKNLETETSAYENLERIYGDLGDFQYEKRETIKYEENLEETEE